MRKQNNRGGRTDNLLDLSTLLSMYVCMHAFIQL
jgi:hypothetical protein